MKRAMDNKTLETMFEGMGLLIVHIFFNHIWRFFKMYLGEDFTLANYKICMVIFMAKHGMIYPKHYDKLEIIAGRFFNS